MLTNVCFQVCSREVITGAVRSKRSFARPVKLRFKPGGCPLLAHLTGPKMDDTHVNRGARDEGHTIF
jgi:hypothetical protein